MRRPRRGRGPRRRGHRQHLRGHRRGRAPGAPGDPPRAPRAARARASWSPAAARRSTRRATPRWPRSTRWSATPRSCAPGSGSGLAAPAPRRAGAGRATSWRVRETAGHLVDGLAGRTRAFLQIQQGCDHRCTFCIIPYGRGPSRSVPAGAVVRQARHLVEQGYARDRADRRRYHLLRRRPAGPADARPARAAPAAPGAGAAAPAPVLDRSGRDRRRSGAAAGRRSRA